MKKIVHIAKNHKEAEAWDVQQQISMTPDQRQKIAWELKRRFYGSNTPDVRQSRVVRICKMSDLK